MKSWLKVVPLILILCACSTGYRVQDGSLAAATGGFRDYAGPGKLRRVYITANGLTKPETVSEMILLRGAEMAKKDGKNHLLIYASVPDAIRGLYRSAPHVDSSFMGSSATTYFLFSETNEPGALNADEIIAKLGPKYLGNR